MAVFGEGEEGETWVAPRDVRVIVVHAPVNMDEGEEFYLQVDNQVRKGKAPRNGVEKGETIALPAPPKLGIASGGVLPFGYSGIPVIPVGILPAPRG
ncbi:hypothetical protein ACHAWF_014150 [Thalassiosira exigua]